MTHREFKQVHVGDRVVCGGNWREVTAIDHEKGLITVNEPKSLPYAKVRLKPKEKEPVSHFFQMKGLTTMDIADATGKMHSDVLGDLHKLFKADAAFMDEMQRCQLKKSKKLECYYLTPKGCLMLSRGYDPQTCYKVLNKLELVNIQADNGTEVNKNREYTL